MDTYKAEADAQSNAELSRERKVVGRKQKEKERVKHYYSNGNGFSDKNRKLPQEHTNQIIKSFLMRICNSTKSNQNH